jgi:adenosylcobinamide hydrolase
MFEPTVVDGVLQVHRAGTYWLSSGWGGGYRRADAAYNVSVPEGWNRTDIDDYVADRRTRAGFAIDGPALLTGVEMRHARGARLGPVVAYATVGLSNPAALPPEPAATDANATPPPTSTHDEQPDVGTVNLLVGTTRALDDAALATLLGVVVEAKTATLLAEAGFPGTTSDAVVVGSDETGEAATFAGSATEVGAAARACVRDAVRASFEARYDEEAPPDSVAEADYGVVTDRRAEVFAP